MREIALGLLLVAWGCGGTGGVTPSTSGGGQSAVAGAGTSSGGSGDSGGGGASTAGGSPNGGSSASGSPASGGAPAAGNPPGITLGDSPTEACIAYAWAVCARLDECNSATGGVVGNCTRYTIDCPDLSFSPGATRTAALLKECAAAYAAMSCDDLHADKLPPCVTPGTNLLGDGCKFASQCASLNCVSSETSCGSCVARAASGESCSEPNVLCESGTSCDPRAKTCGPITVRGLNEPCEPPLAPCSPGAYCKSDSQGGATCVAESKSNESCAQHPCAPGNYCAAADSICRPNPSPGSPCGVNEVNGLVCEDGALCEAPRGATSGTCKPVPKAGDPCVVTPNGPELGVCYRRGMRCDTSVSPAICRGPGKPGDVCSVDDDCAGFSTCDCVGAQQADCAERRCVELKVAGQPCTAPNTRCHPGFECVAGACQALTLQGEYAAACDGP